MAVDQDRLAEPRQRLVEKPLKRQVIGSPATTDTVLRLAERQLAPVDCAPVRHHPGDDPEAGGDPGVVGGAPHVVDERGVELLGRPVQVDIGARRQGREQRRPEGRNVGEELVDVGVFGRADELLVKHGVRQEIGRVGAAGMRRGEHHARGPRGGQPQLIRPIAHPPTSIDGDYRGFSHGAKSP